METTDDDALTASAPENGAWTFDEKVTAAFENMLERSIPNYPEMRIIVRRSADWLIDRAKFSGTKTPQIWDLGASRGSALAPLVDRWGATARFTAMEISDPMLDVLRSRFGGYVDANVVRVLKHDLREGLPGSVGQANLILSVLTMQFVPIEYRHRLLRDCYERLQPGGGLILVEKVIGESDESNRLLVDLYYDLKRENGYEQEAIDRKRMALEGVLVPLTASINETWIKQAGFDVVEVVWGWANFRAWLAVKR